MIEYLDKMSLKIIILNYPFIIQLVKTTKYRSILVTIPSLGQWCLDQIKSKHSVDIFCQMLVMKVFKVRECFASTADVGYTFLLPCVHVLVCRPYCGASLFSLRLK